MKKIGKNTKLYLIGMIIGGMAFGLTTVIADTIINGTSVAYKTTTVKAAIDELYGLADLKPRVENLEALTQKDKMIKVVDQIESRSLPPGKNYFYNFTIPKTGMYIFYCHRWDNVGELHQTYTSLGFGDKTFSSNSKYSGAGAQNTVFLAVLANEGDVLRIGEYNYLSGNLAMSFNIVGYYLGSGTSV